jgi:hypothetical protein
MTEAPQEITELPLPVSATTVDARAPLPQQATNTYTGYEYARQIASSALRDSLDAPRVRRGPASNLSWRTATASVLTSPASPRQRLMNVSGSVPSRPIVRNRWPQRRHHMQGWSVRSLCDGGGQAKRHSLLHRARLVAEESPIVAPVPLEIRL